MRIAGLKIIETDKMKVGPFEDWSRVRSPGRARRRRKKHRQNIRIYYLPDPNLMRTADTLIGHPETIARLRAEITLRSQGSE